MLDGRLGFTDKLFQSFLECGNTFVHTPTLLSLTLTIQMCVCVCVCPVNIPFQLNTHTQRERERERAVLAPLLKPITYVRCTICLQHKHHVVADVALVFVFCCSSRSPY